MSTPTIRTPPLVHAIIPLVSLAVLIAGALALYGLDALDGPIQVALLLCCALAALIAMRNGHQFQAVQEAGREAIASVSSAVFILFAVGALIGVWNLSGTIPTLVYYGIQVLSPGWYYAAAAIICAVVALSIGSSWTTAATIGVGLVGIAGLIGVSPAITAGAVISGAYLGDKTSPLSETTVLTSQLVGVDLYQHIKRQVWTSVPAFGIALVVFFILGLTRNDTVTAAETTSDLDKLNEVFNITPLALLPLALLVFMSIRKIPATLSLLAATLFAGVLGAFLQPTVYADFISGGGSVVIESIKAIWGAMANGFSIDTGIADIDRLLSRGGHGQHAAHHLADPRRGHLRRHARGVRPDRSPHRSDGRRRKEHRPALPHRLRLRLRAEPGRRRPVHRAGLADQGLQGRVRASRAGPDQPVSSGGRQRHGHLTIGALELLRGVHERYVGGLDAPVSSVRHLLLRQPRSQLAVWLHRIPDRARRAHARADQ